MAVLDGSGKLRGSAGSGGSDGLFDVVVDLVSLDVFVSGDAVHDSDQFLRIHVFLLFSFSTEHIERTKKAKQKRPAKIWRPSA